MKKNLLMLALLLPAMTGWAQTDVIKASASVDSPENLFTMKNGNGLTMTSFTSPTETEGNAGKFAFYAEDGKDNSYYIYSVDSKKWVSYTKSASYSSGTNKAKLVADKASAQPWKAQKVNAGGGDVYQFMPYTTSGSAASQYMNWYGGKDSNPLDNTNITIGLWQQGASQDAGSRWIVSEVQIYTYTMDLEDGVSVTINGQTYTDGQSVTVTGALSPSDVVASQKEGKFAVVNVDNDTKTVSVTYYDMPALRESQPYTQAWVYPKQQDAVGAAVSEKEGDVYTLYNNVLAASFLKGEKNIYFLGSKAMNLVAGTELFIVGFGNGEKVAASQMTMKSFEQKDLSATPTAIGGAEHYAGKALEAVFGYTYKGEEIEILWRAVLRDGSHYLRTEMELKGVGNVDMFDIIAMTYNVDAKEAGSKPATIGNTRGKVIMSNKIFAGLETPTAYNTVGGASDDEDKWDLVSTPVTDNVAASAWAKKDINDVPMRIQEVGGSDKTYYTYTKEVELKKNQKVTSTLTYKGGAKRFDIDGVVLLDENGSIVASDYHHGYTGSAKENNSYSFIVPNDGKFSVCMYIDGREGDIVSTAEFKVEVYEGKGGVDVTSDIVNIQGRWSRNTTLAKDETWKVAAVVGLIAQDGEQSNANIRKTQKRRSFLAYSERERAVPWRAVPAYISWYELQINRNNAAPGREHIDNTKAVDVLNVMAQWKTQFFDRYGMSPKMFVIDDGWDLYGEWTFHSSFPNELRDMSKAAKEMGAGIGAWLGPVGGYGQSGNYRRQYWSDKGGMQLSNPRYYKAFKDAAYNLVCNQDGTEGYQLGSDNYVFFKFDGISGQFSSVGPDNGDVGNENAEGIIRLERYVREELREDIFFNTTVGTWASPFWYQISDATWRQENDYDEIGNNSNKRENWITYRDNLVHQNYVTNSPICPINTLMTHGFILTKFGPPAGAPRDYKSVLNELRCAFACGSGLVELYNDYDLMNSINGGQLWKDLAELMQWQNDNADVLMDAHWVGGDPWTGSKAEIYGWAAWNGEKVTLTLRNGANTQQSIKITLREAFEIPANINGSIVLNKCFADQADLQGLTEGEAINIDTELTLTLPASSVYMFGGRDSEAPVVAVESISFDKAQYEVEKGAAVAIVATVNPTNATNKALEWTSSDEKVATVKNGVVSGVSAGKATITATAKDGSGVVCQAEVTVTETFVEGITFDKTQYEVEEGAYVTIVATITPANASTKTLEWTTSDKAVATVDENGKVRGISAGKATITATAMDGTGVVCQAEVTVTPVVYGVNFDKNYTGGTDRAVTQIVFATAAGEAQTIDIDASERENRYLDLTKVEGKELSCEAGEEINVTIKYAGVWMHGYVYIDLDNDQRFSFKDGETDQSGTDLVSFYYYSGDFNNADSGVNSLGEAMSGSALNPGSSIPCPKFNAPEAGTYRIRFKVDWNSVDAGGQLAADGTPTGSNGILANRGTIIDATLKVLGDETGIDEVKTENGNVKADFYDLSGRKTNASQHGVFIQNGKKVVR